MALVGCRIAFASDTASCKVLHNGAYRYCYLENSTRNRVSDQTFFYAFRETLISFVVWRSQSLELPLKFLIGQCRMSSGYQSELECILVHWNDYSIASTTNHAESTNHVVCFKRAIRACRTSRSESSDSTDTLAGCDDGG